jgi:PEP-CTERM motif-containing protein
VDFLAPVTSVSIDSFVLLSPEGFGTPGTGFLSAFDGTTFLGSASTTSSETWQTLTVSFANITSVRFSGTPGSYPSTAWFDNLVFTSATDGGGGNGDGETPVPEPSSLVMLAMGALGCVGVGRRNKAAV